MSWWSQVHSLRSDPGVGQSAPCVIVVKTEHAEVYNPNATTKSVPDQEWREVNVFENETHWGTPSTPLNAQFYPQEQDRDQRGLHQDALIKALTNLFFCLSGR